MHGEQACWGGPAWRTQLRLVGLQKHHFSNLQLRSYRNLQSYVLQNSGAVVLGTSAICFQGQSRLLVPGRSEWSRVVVPWESKAGSTFSLRWKKAG